MRHRYILTHPGTETETVRHILAQLGRRLITITKPADVANAPMDGLILLGGVDIAPHIYGQTNSYSQTGNSLRDTTEIALLRRARALHVPVLGICRGHQLIAAHFGGTLLQDITLELGVRHPSQHKLVGISDLLAKHMPTSMVNSYHHQAIDNVPPNFLPLAWSNDGLTEAIWFPGILGVQWHPEMLYRADPRWLNLFRWFVDGLDV